MLSSRALYTQQWVNDHLDLLNYAREIEDVEWQEELFLALQDQQARIGQEIKQQKKDQLWRRYDAINGLLLELYSELRNTGITEQQGLMGRLMELKQQRLEISRQLATIG
ncbi:MAG: hypothetical protein K0R57_1013 [Paenibacillaceae bacterium]|jgi:hypothetical protein|nr:hypothetical protein [Paenibacillaceae bacterium]